MKKAIYVVFVAVVLLCCTLPLFGCDGCSSGNEIPDADIVSEHTYSNGVCTECGYEASLWDGEAAFDFASGSGTADDPYIISNAEEFAFFASTSSNMSFSGTYIRLTANIDLNGLEWTPIRSFAGYFDGAGHTVSSFIITKAASAAGLFASVSGSVVDLGVDNFFIGYDIADESVLSSTTLARCGGLAGSVGNGDISGCSVTRGRIFVTASMGELSLGGCAGYISVAADITNVQTDVDIYGEQYGDGSALNCGGIVGKSGGDRAGASITNCFSSGSVEAWCKEDGMFSTSSRVCIGGIVGDMDVGNVTACATECDIVLSGQERRRRVYAGSVAGDFDKDLENCFASETQTYEEFGESSDFYAMNDDGQVTLMTPTGLCARLSELWDNDVWSFGGSPYLTLFGEM